VQLLLSKVTQVEGDTLFINGTNIPRWKVFIPGSDSSICIKIKDNNNGTPMYYPQLEKGDNTNPTTFKADTEEICRAIKQNSDNLTEELD
jgi:hypothetical protein